MSRQGIAALCILIITTAGAETVLRRITWENAPAETTYGTIIEDSAGGRQPARCLKVMHPEAEAATLTVLSVDAPGIEEAAYALRGQVKYEDVDGKAYLEMWNVFENGDRFFTRTLSATGPCSGFRGLRTGGRSCCRSSCRREKSALPA